MKKILLIGLSLFSVLALLSCKDADEDKVELKGTLEVSDITSSTAKVTLEITDEKVIDKEEIKITVTVKDVDEATKEVTYVKGTKEYTIDGLTKETDYVVTLTGFGELENKVSSKSFKTIDEVVDVALVGDITGTMTYTVTDTTITVTTNITITLTSGDFAGLEAELLAINMADLNTEEGATPPTPVGVITYVEGTTEYVFDGLTPSTNYMISFSIKEGLEDVTVANLLIMPSTTA